MFGRSTQLPIDAVFGDDASPFVDSKTPQEYATDRRHALQTVFDVVGQKLKLNKSVMQSQYKKKIHFKDYLQGAKVWLHVKYYKTGENRKLGPRRRGPWTIIRKLPNGVNFELEHNQTKETKLVHHDRLMPVVQGKNLDQR